MHASEEIKRPVVSREKLEGLLAFRYAQIAHSRAFCTCGISVLKCCLGYQQSRRNSSRDRTAATGYEECECGQDDMIVSMDWKNRKENSNLLFLACIKRRIYRVSFQAQLSQVYGRPVVVSVDPVGLGRWWNKNQPLIWGASGLLSNAMPLTQRKSVLTPLRASFSLSRFCAGVHQQ